METHAPIALGKPADKGDKVLERRFRLTRRYSHILERGGRLLDVGCGNGELTRLFAPSFSTTIGMDVQVEPMKTSEVDACWIRAAGESIPLADNSLDAITCFEVLEHVQDPASTVREFFRVLKPGGQAVISVPNKWWVFETHGAYLPLLPWNRVPFFSWLPESLHDRWAKARIYTRQKFADTLRAGGFRRYDIHYLTAPMDRARPLWLQRFLQATLFGTDTTPIPFISVSHIAIVTKEG